MTEVNVDDDCPLNKLALGSGEHVVEKCEDNPGIHFYDEGSRSPIADEVKFDAVNLDFATIDKEKEEPSTSKKRSKCEQCGKTFGKLSLLKGHIRFVHREKRVPCDLCEEKFRNESELKHHVFTIHEKQKLQCQVPGCDKSYSRQFDLLKHYQVHHPEFAVVTFKKPRYQRWTLDYLEIVEEGEKVLVCKLCGERFQDLDSTNKHLWQEHGRKKKFACGICDYVTFQNCGIKKHQRLVHKIQPEKAQMEVENVKSESDEVLEDNDEYILP